MFPPAGGGGRLGLGWKYFCLQALLKETFSCQCGTTALLLGHIPYHGYKNKQTRPLPAAGGSHSLCPNPTALPLSHVSALLKDSINLERTKESSKKDTGCLPVSLPHIQLFSTSLRSLLPLPVTSHLPLAPSFLLCNSLRAQSGQA